jgi:hypothetical protein
MKKTLLAGFLFLPLCFIAVSQNKKTAFVKNENNKHFCYSELNFDDVRKPGIENLNTEVAISTLDTVKLHTIIRQEISLKNLSQINKNGWLIFTKLTSDGQIVSTCFVFKNSSGVDESELSRVADRIKTEIRWNLRFNNKPNELFYLGLGIRGYK